MKPSFRSGFCATDAGAQHGVEEFAVVDDREDGFLRQRLPLFDREASSQFENQAGNVDLAGAHLRAVAALNAQALDFV